ncbi:unnamed protein product [Malus baccata var. baccata]
MASVSITAPLRQSLQLPWQTGLLGPLFSVGTSSVPSSDIRKDISGVSPSEEAPKPCCGCLGRDSFAKAAAKVGPAVVNISAPEGAYGITPGKSIGSGTIIAILTCAHTVVDFYGLRASSKGKMVPACQNLYENSFTCHYLQDDKILQFEDANQFLDLPFQTRSLYIAIGTYCYLSIFRQVVWLGDIDRVKGYVVDFLSVSLHAVSRDRHLSLHLHSVYRCRS